MSLRQNGKYQFPDEKEICERHTAFSASIDTAAFSASIYTAVFSAAIDTDTFTFAI